MKTIIFFNDSVNKPGIKVIEKIFSLFVSQHVNCFMLQNELASFKECASQ